MRPQQRSPARLHSDLRASASPAAQARAERTASPIFRATAVGPTTVRAGLILFFPIRARSLRPPSRSGTENARRGSSPQMAASLRVSHHSPSRIGRCLRTAGVWARQSDRRAVAFRRLDVGRIPRESPSTSGVAAALPRYPDDRAGQLCRPRQIADRGQPTFSGSRSSGATTTAVLGSGSSDLRPMTNATRKDIHGRTPARGSSRRIGWLAR